MKLPMTAETAPVATDPEGVVRVGGTRVALDTVIYAFREGASAEEIASRFPALKLADVYGAITYYLRHREAVDEYLAERERGAEEVRRLNETRFPPAGVRERLLARRIG